MPVSLSPLRHSLAILIRRHPFLCLVQHFCNRAAGASSTSDIDFGAGSALALFAVPGAFTAILLLGKYSSLLQWMRGQSRFNPYLVCLPDEYFFIVYSMAVTGLVTLLRWDQLLPDARDFANLAPLSLSLRKIFIANVVALATLAAVFAIDINLVSSVIFPLFVTLQADSFVALCEFILAHAIAALGISAFTFLALIALQGMLMAAFPDRLYRRVALFVRTVLLIGLVGILVSVFLIPIPFLQVNHASTGAALWWPPLWFLSLFESHVRELRSHSLLGTGPAWRALGSAGLLAICGFSLSYTRYFLTIPERQSGPASRSSRKWLPFPSALAVFRPLLRPGLETACFQFTCRTLVRSELQLLFAGLWAGLGLLLMLQGIRSPSLATSEATAQALLVAPLTFTLFSLGGLRFVFDLPSMAYANWPFRLLAVNESHLVRTACRKLLLFIGLLPLVLIWFLIALYQNGPQQAIIYLSFHLLAICLLVEVLLWKFRKIPFTCDFTPNRDRLLIVVIGSLVVLLLVLPTLARMEAYTLTHPLALPLFVVSLLGALVWLYRNGHPDSDTLLYEDRGLEPFALLRLGND